MLLESKDNKLLRTAKGQLYKDAIVPLDRNHVALIDATQVLTEESRYQPAIRLQAIESDKPIDSRERLELVVFLPDVGEGVRRYQAEFILDRSILAANHAQAVTAFALADQPNVCITAMQYRSAWFPALTRP